MTYFETLKKLLWDFKLFVWNFKFFYIIFVWVLATLLASLEPFFAAKWISYIEEYFKTWILDKNTLYIFFGVWIWFILLNAILRFYHRFSLVDVSALKYYVEKSIYYKDKILNITQWVFLEKKWGTYYKIIDRWTDSIFATIFIFFLEISVSVISVIFISIVIAFINIKLTLATLAVVPIFIAMWYYFNGKTRAAQEAIHKKWESFFGILWDYVTNLTLVKTLTFEKSASKELNKLQLETLALQIPLSRKWGIADIYTHFMINISRLLVLFTGIFLIQSSEITFATLFLFFSYIGYIYFPISYIFGSLKNLQKNLESIKKLYLEFDNIAQDEDIKWAADIEKISWKIEFKNVNFSYKNEDENEVLKDINFSINPWEKIALVGSTGSWKSTITSLLLRFWEIKKGHIYLDGIDTKKITKKSLRKHIWIVMQDNSLFNTTIKNNLLFAKADATEEEIIEALKKAKADFVLKQKDGIHTEIGERWLKLSGWEKQRLNIARIFLKNPEILILDEATSALDNKTEVEIQNSLDELISWKTSIIIAHRLSTIKKVDRILVLENGKIVEIWNYEELLAKKGKFFELANPDKMVMN